MKDFQLTSDRNIIRDLNIKQLGYDDIYDNHMRTEQ
jgi:hypothetical protein